MASLVLLNLTTQFLDRAPSTVPPTDVSYLSEMETHLKSKAGSVIERFTSEDYTVDLSLELNTAQTTTTTYIPGEKILKSSQEKFESHVSSKGESTDQAATQLSSDEGGSGNYQNRVVSQSWELTGTWEETTDVRPRISAIRCCVTLAKGENIDHDHLYRSLSYELGINLARGDQLQIVEQ